MHGETVKFNRYSCLISSKLAHSLQFFEEYSNVIFMKIRPVGTELFYADRRTGMTKLIATFRSFANALNKSVDLQWISFVLNIKCYNSSIMNRPRMYLDCTEIRIEIVSLWYKDCKKKETKRHFTVLEIGSYRKKKWYFTELLRGILREFCAQLQ